MCTCIFFILPSDCWFVLVFFLIKQRFEVICTFPNQLGVTPQTIEIVTYGSDDLLPCAVLFDADTGRQDLYRRRAV